VLGNENRTTVAIGTSNEYLEVRGLTLAQGRPFSAGEMAAGTPACILGASVREALFDARNPVGATVRIGSVACAVIGVLSSKGGSTMGPDQDDVVLMPIGFYQRRLAGNDNVAAIFIGVEQTRDSAAVVQQITSILREARPRSKGREDDFTVHDMEELMGALSSVTGALTALLAAIASVSLIVGGIGIMNIMLVSVTERTREIGVRLAIGAVGSEVMTQFLTEAVVLSMLGGALGAALGISASLGVAVWLDLPFSVHPDIIALAFAFSATIGVLFGFLPARKAARLSPIAALAHE
jgi:putative ABC transport system permease protein